MNKLTLLLQKLCVPKYMSCIRNTTRSMHPATCMCYTTDPTLPVHSTRSIAFNYYGSGTTAPATAPYFAYFLGAEISGVFGDE